MVTDLSVRIGSLTLKNPIIAASGCFGFGKQYQPLAGFSLSDLGGLSIKGTTPEPREGNATPRLVETPSGLLNSIGLQNPGVEAVVTEVIPAIRDLDVAILANVNDMLIRSSRMPQMAALACFRKAGRSEPVPSDNMPLITVAMVPARLP